MGALFRNLDRLLRGEMTRGDDLQSGRIGIPAGKLVLASLLLGAIYGACMGLFAATGGRQPFWQPLLGTALKVPLLFLLTLLVTFPSLYVFAALANSRLGIRDTLRLLVAAIAVMLGVLASFGPITAFFTLSTNSHTFMVFLNVLFFALAGMVGLSFLNRAINAVFPAGGTPGPSGPGSASGAGSVGSASGASGAEASRARRIFRVWLFIFGIVGAQMAWILRPFIGNPNLEFHLFRPRWSNFFEFILRSMTDQWR